MYIGLQVKYLLSLSGSNKTLIFANTKMSNFIIIRPVEADLFHDDKRTDGRTDRQTDRRDEANTRF